MNLKTIISYFLLQGKKIPSDSSTWPEEWKTIFHKSYDRSLTIQPNVNILESFRNNNKEIISILENRHSTWNVSSPINVEELLFILQEGTNERQSNYKSRRYPSGGGLYPIELYYIHNSKETFEPGVYHYSQVEELLKKIKSINIDVSTLGLPESFSKQTVDGMIVFSYSFSRNINKYGPRGMSLAMVEIGAIAQNFALLATTLGVKTRILAGYNHTAINHLIDTNPQKETSALIMLIGK